MYVHETNCETGETTVREMTEEEAATHARVQAEAHASHEARVAAVQQEAAQRTADLAVLVGDDEAKQAALSRLLGESPQPPPEPPPAPAGGDTAQPNGGNSIAGAPADS